VAVVIPSPRTWLVLHSQTKIFSRQNFCGNSVGRGDQFFDHEPLGPLDRIRSNRGAGRADVGSREASAWLERRQII